MYESTKKGQDKILFNQFLCGVLKIDEKCMEPFFQNT